MSVEQEFTNSAGESVVVGIGDTFEVARFSADGTRRVSVWEIVPIPESAKGITPYIVRARLQAGVYVGSDAEIAPYGIDDEVNFCGDSMPGLMKRQQAIPPQAA